MPHRRRRKADRHAGLGFRHGDLVRITGTPVAYAAETDRVPANIDHFWISVATGSGDPIRIALSTHSRQNAAAGFDPRLRIGVVVSTWTELPSPGLEKSSGLNYTEIENIAAPLYVEYERPALEEFLTDLTSRCVFIEAWGELYVRTHLGIHNVHSMRASCSVLRDFVGRDGAICFYFPDGRTELLLLKYCGQE